MKEDVFIDSGAWSLFRLHVLKTGKKAEKMGKHGRKLEEPDVKTGSGAADYTFYDLSKGSEFRSYLEDYAQFIREYAPRGVRFFANVDVIGNPDLTWEVQRFFEEECGLHPVPVVHFGTSMKYLDRYLEKGYKMVGLGGFARRPEKAEAIKWLDDAFLRICPASNDRLPITKVHGFAMTSWHLMRRWPWYCMTDNHEVLTKRGWKSRQDVFIGDEILAYKHGKSYWSKVLDRPEFEIDDEIHTLENRNIYAEVTANHRWVLNRKTGIEVVKETWDMMCRNVNDTIPRCADHRSFPEKTYSDELVELMAWFWTEGCYRNHRPGRTPSIGLYQSEKVNPEKVQAIRNLLDRCGGAWNEQKSHPEGMRMFEARGPVVRKLLALCPKDKGKLIPLDFVTKLTKKQLSLFIETSVKADGYNNGMLRRTCFTMGQAYGKNIEVFRIALILAGYPTSTHKSGNMEFVRTSSVDGIYPLKCRYTVKSFKGKVWCVSVEEGSFFTRCKGHVYVTGNSVDSTSWLLYGTYGLMCVPHWKSETGFRYDRPPMIVSVSHRGRPIDYKTRMHISQNHADTAEVRKATMRWLEYIGLELGSVNKKGEMVHPGVGSSNEIRTSANLRYFMELEASLPKWPWPLDPKIVGQNTTDYHRGFGLL